MSSQSTLVVPPVRRPSFSPTRLGSLLCSAGLMLLAPGTAPAQETDRATAPARVFEIRGFDIVDDAGLLDEGLRQQIQAEFDAARGHDRDVAGITAARLAAQAAADRARPGRLVVNVPEQTLQGGRVRVVVAATPGVRVGRVEALGDNGFDAANVRTSVPALTEGVDLDADALDRQLRLGELHPFKRTNVTFGLQPDGTPVALVKAQAERSRVAYATLDNYGPRGSRERVGAGFVDGNLTSRDDVLSLSATMADPRRFKAVAASYTLPFYRYGQMLELAAARSESDSANTVDLFHINGTGTAASARWLYLLPRWSDTNLRLTAGYLYHRVKNNVTFQALPHTGSLLPSGATAPLSLGVEGDWRPAGLPALVKGALGVSRNFAGQLGSSSRQQLDTIRRGAGSFTLLGSRLQLDSEFTHGWQLRAAAQGQYTRDALTAADQMNVSGPYAVRGLRDTGLLGDRALVLNLEATTPPLAQFHQDGATVPTTLRGWGFVDWGTARRNQALVGELAKADIASTGAGLKIAGSRGNIDIYLARRISGLPHDTSKSRHSLWFTALMRF
ncbi:ShlB/FhaC/HecB family hemolysin secretion/activation protein [Xylophilus sp. GOD-11R]|uniref:ShlB/FhaC/HecB family hemolysin secretion/activation protein n=1 Tax=Xylophilus sp. GOD-11R TaxID=3089814 RepID=UPI00298C3AE7|nr:ShlB/FhaC/HecB family hemolysin secretion/activation protein [Xylophilus sp. GOD-11R]WPB57982.1 ShlB/FhaC/HecB family hemolysin secretion/activation protein [Xylophilus sp. GOD-11R]